MLEISDTKTRDYIKTSPNSYVLFLCESFLNIVNGNVPTNKNFLKNYKNEFNFILSKETSLNEKRQVHSEIHWSFVLSLLKVENAH